MIIKIGTAKKLIRAGKARVMGTCIDNGCRWLVIERLDLQRIDHVRIERQ